MEVLVTIVVIAALGMWTLATFSRLSRLRKNVTLAWKRLEANQQDEAVRTVYNRQVAAYNAVLESFPAYIIAPAAGFKPARVFGKTDN